MLPEASWKDRILFFLGRREAFLVGDDSMRPELKVGDAILINPNEEIALGDLVLTLHLSKENVKILKKIREISSENKYLVVDGNLTESNNLDEIKRKDILGKAICRLK